MYINSIWIYIAVAISVQSVLSDSNDSLNENPSKHLIGLHVNTKTTPLRTRERRDIGDDPDADPFDVINFQDPFRFKACEKKLWKYAEAAANFSRCIVTYARPIRMCEWCIGHYNGVKDAFDVITAEDGHKCKEVLLQADRIQIIEHTLNQAMTLWKTSNCDNCYGSDNLLTEYTIKFNKLCNETKDCMERNNGTTCTPQAQNGSSCRAAACVNCSDSYATLDSYYKEIVKNYTMENMCMDIVDMMNTTRKIWSQYLNCTSHNNEIVVLFTIVTFVCLFPVIFYLGSWIQSDEQKSKIVPQKRLASSRSAAHLCVN